MPHRISRLTPARTDRWSRLGIAIITAAVSGALVIPLLAVLPQTRDTPTPQNGFLGRVIDAQGPVDPWGKSVGDLNGDGRPDFIVGGHESGELVWYENPSWIRRVLLKGHQFGTDFEVGDIDGDGRLDVVGLTDQKIFWLRNPAWEFSVIDNVRLHDLELADFDGDGKLDIVARNQSAFGGSGNSVLVYLQRTGRWDRYGLSCPDGEGLKVADINGDRRPDIVVNGVWFQNAGALSAQEWQTRSYTSTWSWPHAFIDVGDVDGDGHGDIVLAPSEPAGKRYRVSWFSGRNLTSAEWPENIVDGDVETVRHFVAVADMDNDGNTDIITASMHQGSAPHEVTVYLNIDEGRRWSKQPISFRGSHSMRLVDVDGDSDWDVFGANWSGKHQEVKLWENLTCPSDGTGWVRHVVDGERPWRAIFVASADIDSDGHIDIVSGGWWYRNPGQLDGHWQRHRIGGGANNMAAIVDVDGDNRPDVLATTGKGSNDSADFVLAHNSGAGSFQIQNIARGRGDFLQGVTVGQFTSPGRIQVALSWHTADMGVQMLTSPARPTEQPWEWSILSRFSQDEALSAGDIDKDGDQEILLGTVWLRNDGETWSKRRITTFPDAPDRNVLADINGDSRLDAVVGYQAISKPGKLAWYSHGGDPTAQWKEHVIATVVGPMSLGVGDMDGDGDLDVVVGEHNLADPARARMLVFENADGSGTSWAEHLVFVGDEHHDGAHLVDLDKDGDLDIVSIGWGHSRVLVYENRVNRCRPSGNRTYGRLLLPAEPLNQSN